MSDLNDDNQFEEFTPEEEALPEEEMASEAAESGTGNRNFKIALFAIIGLIVLGFALILFLVLRKPAASATLVEQQNRMATNAAIAASGTEQVMAQIAAQLATSTPAPTQVPPTNTPVVAVPTATSTPTEAPVAPAGQAETPDPTLLAAQGTPQVGGGATLSPGQMRTATLGALLTQVAANQAGAGTPQAGGGVLATSTALPSTGFADEVGLPGLFGLALGLIVLIFLARTLRLTTK